MTTQGPAPLPPTTVLHSKPITQASAHDFLAAYLDRATTDPALQPNASISEHGPVSRTTAAAPNLILHNLKRVQAGLGGEILGRDLTVAKQNPGEDYLDAAVAAGEEDNNTSTDGKEQQQQQYAAKDDGDEMAWKEPVMDTEAEAFEEQQAAQAGIDKEERKRKKKERRLEEKKAKAKSDD